MNVKEQERAAKKFAQYWNGKGDEKSDTQSFWLSLLRDVYGLKEPEKYVEFEKRVMLSNQSFIDAYIKDTRVLIEQKSIYKDIRKPIKQSDGSELTPYEQAKRYAEDLPFSEKPRWIIVSNFEEFIVYDENKSRNEREVASIKLVELEKEYYLMDFLVDENAVTLQKEMEISFKAGEIVGVLYNALVKQYKFLEEKDENGKPTERALKEQRSLNVLCVRLVFCFYAEDAGLFGKHNLFHDYLAKYEHNPKDFRRELLDVFRVLDTKTEDRDPYDEELNEFPYVNGGLFATMNIELPTFSEEIIDIILNKSSLDFDWSDISPTIFGAVFESTLNPETRREGGMHYTSIENIHKVIDPLFLNDLKEELEEIKQLKQLNKIREKVDAYKEKLASLKFLDPACGSGNFLTESYISLRKLENEALSLTVKHGQQLLGFEDDVNNPIKVSIHQFYGIELNDFAVTVAKAALWIAESQMLKKTEEIIAMNLDFLPLKSYANIIEGNALRMDWNDVIPANELNYIMGNPPFVGFTYMNDEQKKDMADLFPGIKNLDFVAGWYKKSSEYIKDTKIECGLVSTNSINQGETAERLWNNVNLKINFAYRTFIWDSEATLKAHVHCVIIGFAAFDKNKKYIYEDDLIKEVKNINYYLYDAPNVLVKSRNKPLCNVSPMIYGNKPADGGNLIIEETDLQEFLNKKDGSNQYIKPLLGAVEFLHNKHRYCLWLENVSPSEIKKCSLIMDRINKCKESRLSSKAAGIRKFADSPSLFAQRTQPVGEPFILIPRVSSERRKYVPMGFLDGNTIVTDAVQIIPNATLYEFSIITSIIHMAWMRVVAGRLKSDYRYSKDVVYNNFIWPNLDDSLKTNLETKAKQILEARNLYPNSSLADLYDPLLMPIELKKAHEANDKAVMKAYGFKSTMSEEDIVAELMKLYQKKIDKNK